MTTVLVVPGGTREVFREDWELAGRDEPYVDHVTDDLTAFLGAIAANLTSRGCTPTNRRNRG
jgi:putative hydrolase of the HAD superfamily